MRGTQIDSRQAKHLGVRRQRTRPGTKHHAAARHVIELRHRFGHHEGMMIGQRFHPCAQSDVLGALRRRGNKDFRSSDDLKAAGMMLADPCLVEAKLVQQRHELQIAFERVGGVKIGGMEWPHEHAETQRLARQCAACRFIHFSRPSPAHVKRLLLAILATETNAGTSC